VSSARRRIEVAVIWFYATNERRTDKHEMRKHRTAIGALAAALLAVLAVPAATMAEEAIPPGNSAVNQYTESLPTPTGHTDTEKGGKKSHRSPEKTLGSRNAERLEEHGADGRAAAEAAAETAPSTSVPATDSEEEAVATPPANSGKGNGGGGRAAHSDDGGPSDREAARAGAGKAALVSAQIEEPSGSSGLGEAFGEATGTSAAGQMGWLLPLLILAIAAWASAYAMRHRRRVG
jgi:hypothetical protein